MKEPRPTAFQSAFCIPQGTVFAPPPGTLWSTQVWCLPFLPHPWVPRKLPVTWINHDADQQQRLSHVSSRRGEADLTERSNRGRMACYPQRSLAQCQGSARLRLSASYPCPASEGDGAGGDAGALWRQLVVRWCTRTGCPPIRFYKRGWVRPGCGSLTF